jgi:parallel beta-helix repeat protein
MTGAHRADGVRPARSMPHTRRLRRALIVLVVLGAVVALLGGRGGGAPLQASTASAITGHAGSTTFWSGSASTASTAAPANLRAGDAVLSYLETASTSGVLCQASTKVLDQVRGAVRLAACLSQVGTTPPASFSAALTPAGPVAMITLAFSGVDAQTPVDVQASSATSNSPSVRTTMANEVLVLGEGSNATAATATAPTGSTLVRSLNNGANAQVAVAVMGTSAAGLVSSKRWTVTPNGSRTTAATIALRPATSTPTPTPTPTTTTPTSTPATPTTTPTPTHTTTPTLTPTTTPRPPSSAAPQLATRCAAGGGTVIGISDDAQRVVDAHPAGTTYLVKSGIHQNNFSVQPKSGDTFCGEPGAVLDGGRALATAFSGGATNVTLDSITVQNYASAKQGAAIQPESHAGGWLVRNVSALHNGWAGLLVADGMHILGGHYNDNDQLGIGGNEATGIVLDGLDSDPNTIDGPEMARNHTLHASCLWEAGGMKWDFGQVTIRNAYVHDNDCRGLWADINAHDTLIENSLIEHNKAEGIAYEISHGAVIRNNRIYDNGYVASGWYWDGGVTIEASFDVEVYGNRLSGNYNGITGVQQDRPDSTPPAHLLDHVYVHDNVICATGGGGHATGVVADNGANLAARDITFSGNTIQSAACE